MSCFLQNVNSKQLLTVTVDLIAQASTDATFHGKTALAWAKARGHRRVAAVIQAAAVDRIVLTEPVLLAAGG